MEVLSDESESMRWNAKHPSGAYMKPQRVEPTSCELEAHAVDGFLWRRLALSQRCCEAFEFSRANFHRDLFGAAMFGFCRCTKGVPPPP